MWGSCPSVCLYVPSASPRVPRASLYRQDGSAMFKACIGLNCARHIDFLDRRHGSLTHIPDEVYRNEEHLEELLLDMNGLQDLPPVSASDALYQREWDIGRGGEGREYRLGFA